MNDLSAAERSVIAERRRHISAEGWSLEHDDTHTDGEIARAAAAYAFAASLSDWWRANLFPSSFGCLIRELWPDTWDRSWFKPKSRREDLVRAGALVIAEIERIDRTASPDCHWGGGNGVIWCSTCGAEYAYAKGEQRPACPYRSAEGA